MDEEASGMSDELLTTIIQKLDQIINLLSTTNDMGKDSFNIDCAERLFANTNFDLEKTSEQEVAQKCLRRAKILGETLGLK